MTWKKEIYQWIHQNGRCCLHCGSMQSNSSQLCEQCEADLWRRHPQNHVFSLGSRNTKAVSLFKWIPDQDRKVSKLIMAFKEGFLSDASLHYTESFLRRWDGDQMPANAVLVPCPSSKGRQHSQRLAESFSQLLGLPVRDILLKSTKSSPQKKLSLEDRFLNEMSCIESQPDKYVIFIDDIVTTGATALSARRALGPNLGFEVWCLAHRCQLAANSTL